MEKLEDGIERVVAQLLPKEPIIFDKAKFVNDPIHGTVVIEPFEQSIIDTSLFQRLRYIRQTGFTYLVFPTAQHTRFEHSLGVMTIASRIIDVLKKKHPANVDDISRLRVRLAALLHDLGHSAFSHTTEEFYSHLDDIQEFRVRNKQYDAKGAGEIMSMLIIKSKAFKRFFRQLQSKYAHSHADLKSVDINTVADLVTGKFQSPSNGYEADIVSGSIDADKLDYFPRDGRSVGIDVSIDIDRLIQCMEIQKRPTVGRQEPRDSLVINRRGYNALQQLLFARATLTATVYHHHKVRACDSMLKNVLQFHVDKKKPFAKYGVAKGIALSQAANFLLINDSDILAQGGVADSHTTDVATKLTSNLFNRHSFKRVLKITHKTIQAAGESNPIQLDELKAALGGFNNLRADVAARARFVSLVTAHPALSNTLTKYEWALDFPHRPSFKKAGDAQINMSSYHETPDIVPLNEVIPIEQWIEGYATHFGHAYVFGPLDPEIRASLAIAAGDLLSQLPTGPLYLTYKAVAEDIRSLVKKKQAQLGISAFREP